MLFDNVITRVEWLKVGKLPIRNDLLIQPKKFIQDNLDKNKLEHYNSSTGKI